jgi:iron complex outermembrane receptor protein
VVVRPTPNFDIAVDAFKMKITDAIFLVQGNNPNIQNICYDSGGSSQYCQLIGRGLGIYNRNNPQAGSAANAINLYRQTFINLAEIETWGADVEASYRTSIASRPLSLRLLATYQPHVIYRLPGAAPIDYANSAFGTNAVQSSPVWRVTGFVNFKPTDSLTLAVQTRWRSSVERTPEDDVEGTPPVKSVAFVNMNLSYQPQWDKGDLSFFLNIQNVFNTDPPAAGNYLNPTPGNFGEYLQGDDVLGRYYTVGIRFRM